MAVALFPACRRSDPDEDDRADDQHERADPKCCRQRIVQPFTMQRASIVFPTVLKQFSSAYAASRARMNKTSAMEAAKPHRSVVWAARETAQKPRVARRGRPADLADVPHVLTELLHPSAPKCTRPRRPRRKRISMTAIGARPRIAIRSSRSRSFRSSKGVGSAAQTCRGSGNTEPQSGRSQVSKRRRRRQG